MNPEEPINATEELVTPVETPIENKEVRSALELEKVPYNEMTEDEKEYFISALKMKCSELDGLIKRMFEENKRLKETNNKNLALMEDTLTFIKTTVGNSLGSVSLAIKNMEREVK